MRDRLQRLGERWRWFGTALRVHQRFSELNGNALAGAITITAFIALFPLLLVAIAVVGFFSSHSPNLAGELASRLGLSGEAARTLTSAVAKAEQSRRTATVVGLVGLLWSGLALVGALEYAFNSVWQVTGRGLRDKLVGLLWLVGTTVLFALSFALTAALNFLPPGLAPVSIAVSLAIDVPLWLWTMKVLTNRDVGWRALVPGAVLGATGLEVLKALGSFYVPRAVSSASAVYGSLGVVFAILAWLLFFGRLAVYAAVLNVVRWEEDHGTVKVELEAPRLPGQRPLSATRSGDVVTAGR